MENHQIMSISIMEIVIFLKASELESFSKTATYLGITTSMVSKRIVALEKAVGMPLFDRSHNRVVMTPGGRSLSQDWRNMYNSLLYSLEKAAREHYSNSRPISFGLGSSTNSDRYLIPLLSAFDAEVRSSGFLVELRPNFNLLEDLLKGQFDVIFLPLFMSNKIAEYPELDSFVALRYPLLVGMAMENPLSQKEVVSIADLKSCEFIFVKFAAGEEYAKFLGALCAAEGFSPVVGSYVENVDSAYLNTTGNQVFVADRLYRQMQSNATVYRELVGTESGLLAVWRKDAVPNVANFIRYARQFFQECGSLEDRE